MAPWNGPKYPYIHGYFVASFPYCNVRLWVSLFRRFMDTNVYGTGSVEIWKTRHKISVDIRIFLPCTVTELRPTQPTVLTEKLRVKAAD